VTVASDHLLPAGIGPIEPYSEVEDDKDDEEGTEEDNEEDNEEVESSKPSITV
jgi:hypothetical protein